MNAKRTGVPHHKMPQERHHSSRGQVLSTTLAFTLTWSLLNLISVCALCAPTPTPLPAIAHLVQAVDNIDRHFTLRTQLHPVPVLMLLTAPPGPSTQQTLVWRSGVDAPIMQGGFKLLLELSLLGF